MTYPTLQLALSSNNPDHVKIMEYLDGLEDRRRGYRSRLVEKAVLMYIAHQDVRGTDGPEFWTPIKGQEDMTIVLGSRRKNQDSEE